VVGKREQGPASVAPLSIGAGDEELDALGSVGEVLRALAATPTETLARGTVVAGQYRIERVIGEGGMGVVYLARDMKLARAVAIKVSREPSAQAIARSSREAIALARISHPNVVVIHHVGELRGRAYVAMEHVAGGTARSWCAVPNRTAPAIVALYAAAGDGLAAAHAAGLVHRDFKPDNVLVGEDGRPRVADFGLARAAPGEADSGPMGAPSEPRSSRVVGTPAYMAPEQLDGLEVDARADQFAFCTALWEALYGVRPFEGTTPASQRAAMASGEPKRGSSPEAKSVARHIELALRRGLAIDRAARWPSLAPLLQQLRRDPNQMKRRMAALALAGLAVGATLVVARSTRGEAADPCAASGILGEAWSEERAQEIRIALTTRPEPTPWLNRTATRVIGRIEAWSARFDRTSHEVCVQGRGAWSTPLHDRGVACLAERRGQLTAISAALRSSAKDVAEHADDLVDQLAAPERCADAVYLAAAVAPPEDPARAAQVRAAYERLAGLRTLIAAAQHDKAREGAAQVIRDAEAIGYAPLVARARLIHAQALRGADLGAGAFDELHDAYFLARQSRDAETAAAIASDAAMALLNLSRDKEAADWARLAEVDAKLAADPASEARALVALATVAQDQGESARALEYAERLIEVDRRLPEPDVVEPLRTRGHALDALSRRGLALADFEQAVEHVRSRYGEEHPTIAMLLTERALIRLRDNQPEEAEKDARRSLAIALSTADPMSTVVGGALGALGASLTYVGKLDESLAVLDRSLAVSRLHDGPRSYNVASDLNNRGELLARMGRLDDAIASMNEAIAIWSEVVSSSCVEIGIAQLNIADALITADRDEEAFSAATASVAIFEKTKEHIGYPRALVALGLSQLAKAPARARATLGGAEHLDDNPIWQGRRELGLAKACLATGDRAQARVHALAAKEILARGEERRRKQAEALVLKLGAP
jgi:tetratricopeptide (TPR) repeat protein